MNPLNTFSVDRNGQSLRTPALWVAKLVVGSAQEWQQWSHCFPFQIQSLLMIGLYFGGGGAVRGKLLRVQGFTLTIWTRCQNRFSITKFWIYWPAKTSCCLFLISSKRHSQSEDWNSALKVCKHSWLVTGTRTTGNACLYPDVVCTASSFKQVKQKMSLAGS